MAISLLNQLYGFIMVMIIWIILKLKHLIRSITWDASPFQWMKLNFDGSRKHNQKKATGGFVIRDECGKVLVVASFNLGNASILVAECIALRNGLIKASQKGIRHLHIEGDFKLVIDAICGTIRHYWCIDNLV
ncbi:hypothetical protein L1049_001570 [Liquidambar formosana]|uniref:RNase H type-1 domain-containing protein n=1 Tax=Liquidambar formosana TaxID=63359 RepID=A0AAP0NAT2_LIQFO